jgi:hypothetical protein
MKNGKATQRQRPVIGCGLNRETGGAQPSADPGDPARAERTTAMSAIAPTFPGGITCPARQSAQRLSAETLREYMSERCAPGYETSMAEVLQPVDDAQLIELT